MGLFSKKPKTSPNHILFLDYWVAFHIILKIVFLIPLQFLANLMFQQKSLEKVIKNLKKDADRADEAANKVFHDLSKLTGYRLLRRMTKKKPNSTSRYLSVPH